MKKFDEGTWISNGTTKIECVTEEGAKAAWPIHWYELENVPNLRRKRVPLSEDNIREGMQLVHLPDQSRWNVVCVTGPEVCIHNTETNRLRIVGKSILLRDYSEVHA